jgi:hypothetical protein
MRKRAGDYFRFPTDDGGFAIMQYLGEHPLMGDCIICCKSRNGMDFSIESSRIFFYPVDLNIRQKNIEFYQHGSPCRPVPSAIRRPFVFDRKVEYWFIDDNNGTRKVYQLSEDELGLPIGSAVSHIVLKEIYEGIRWFLFEDVDISGGEKRGKA